MKPAPLCGGHSFVSAPNTMESQMRTLDERIQQSGGALAMLLGNPAEHGVFRYPPEWSTWYSEEWARRHTAVVFDQTTHQADTYLRGPDAKRLLTEVAVNSPKGYVVGRAKQLVAVTHSGHFIGDSIVATLSDEEFHVSGVPVLGNWLKYQASAGGYDVDVVREDPYPFDHFTGGAKNYRFQFTGPATQSIVEAAAAHALGQIPFFGISEIEIAGTPARLLNHTMTAQSGEAYSGLEVWGPIEHSQRVLDALLNAGRQFGLQRGGVHAYMSQNLESSGWPPLPLPGIYTGDDLAPYRKSLVEFSIEGMLPLEGSYRPADIESYYSTPWDLGYGRLINYEHDFIGRSALEELKEQPHKRKVWLEWNEDDVIRVMRDSLFGEDGARPKIISLPLSAPMTAYYDEIRDKNGAIGYSGIAGYTSNLRRYVSMSFIDEEKAVEGAQVELLWGDPDSGERAFLNPGYVQTDIRATVRTSPLPRR